MARLQTVDPTRLSVEVLIRLNGGFDDSSQNCGDVYYLPHQRGTVWLRQLLKIEERMANI